MSRPYDFSCSPRHFLGNRPPRVVLALAVLMCAAPAFAQAGTSSVFPSDPSLSYERFGLFIGIDHYLVLKNYDLDGCVNDALTYKSIFVDAGRFDVQRYAVLTNDEATRAGITGTLHELVNQVQTARSKTGKPITVVITYSGHGALVPRQEKNSPLGPLDSSWVASDSDLAGTKNVRGEELFAVHTALRKLGAQVIMISDSCHSGTAYRGFDKARGIDLAPNATGPADGLFDDLLKVAPLPADIAAYNNPPGFVWYAACADAQQAYETTDEKGRHCGKLSLVMCKVLLNATDTTYSGLARQIAQEFAARWPGSEWQQTPEFHAAAGKENGVFFTDQVAPLHAEVKKITAGTAEISLGEIQGITEGTFFRFYAGMNDALARRNEIATGTVQHADAVSSTVKLDKAVPLSAWAMPELVRLRDFSVTLDDDISAAPPPAWLKGKLAELDRSQQLALVTPKDSPSVVIRCLPDNQIGFYLPTAVPGATTGGRSVPPPKPLRLLNPPPNADGYPEMFAENLLYLGRLQRLATLEHACRSPLTSAAAANHLPALAAEIVSRSPPVPLRADPNGGAIPSIQRLRKGDEFILRITNNTTRPMYPTVFTVHGDGTIEILYPQEGDDRTPVTFDRPLEIGADSPFIVSLNDHNLASERTQLKVIATDAPLDFAALLIPPQTGAKAARAIVSRGADDALFNLLRDTLHGGPLTRDVGRNPPPSDWGTLNVVFDAIPKQL